jgi:YVTN family beta-propeller protein
MVISRRAFVALPALAAVGCRRAEPAFNGYAFIANQEGGAIAAVDLGVLAVAKHIPVDGAPSQVLAADSRPSVYALTPENGTVHEIRTDTLKPAGKLAVAPKADAMFLAPDEQMLYVLTRETRTLTAVKLDGLSVVWRMQLPEEPVDLAIAADSKTAAVTSATTLRLLSLTERSTGEPLWRANFGQVKFLRNGERVIAADLGGQRISIFQVLNPRLLVHLPIAVRPENLAFNKLDDGQLFVTGAGADSLVIVYPYNIPEVAETILVGHAPAMMTASNNMLFITSPASGDVSVLDIASHRVIAVVPVGEEPGQVAITPDDQFALVLNRKSGDVSVLNIDAIRPGRNKSTALVTVIPVGSRPVSAALHAV